MAGRTKLPEQTFAYTSIFGHVPLFINTFSA
jgi:hypothetical protein